MKISKDQIKKILVEEIDNNRDLSKAINSLANKIDDLDISIDFLASAITGEQALSIGLRQKALGRVASAHKTRSLDEGHGGEGSMARSQLGRTTELAAMLQSMIQDDSNLEEWVESKITKAHDYLSSVLNYMRGEQLSERVYEPGEKRPIQIIEEDLRDVLSCYMQELVEMGHDSDRVAFGMERLISDIQISGGKGAKCDSMAVRPTIDPTDVPLRRVAEKKLTKPEKKEKEKIVKGMKKSKKDFEDRYGEDAESVMYATATKMAKEKK